jgi:hypothetical protein
MCPGCSISCRPALSPRWTSYLPDGRRVPVCLLEASLVTTLQGSSTPPDDAANYSAHNYSEDSANPPPGPLV